MNLQVDHRGKPTRHVRFQKTGLDYAVSWSVIGLIAILGLIALHLASFVLIPVTLAVVVGLILGLAADRMGTAGIPPMLTAPTLSGLFLAILIVLSSHLAPRPYSRLLRQGRQAEGNPHPECRGSGAGLLFCHRQSVIYALFGIIAALIAWLEQRSSPVLWGVSAFLLSFLPFIGIALVTVAMAVAGLLVHEGVLLGLLPALVFFSVNGFFENLLIPPVMGRRLEVNAFLLFVAIVFWTWLWGAVGAMLAVPLTPVTMTLLGGIVPPGRVQPNLPGWSRLSRLRHVGTVSDADIRP